MYPTTRRNYTDEFKIQAPALRSGVPSLRACSREDRAAGPILGPSA